MGEGGGSEKSGEKKNAQYKHKERSYYQQKDGQNNERIDARW